MVVQRSGLFQELKTLIHVGTMGQPHAELAEEVRAEAHKIEIEYSDSPEDVTILDYFRSTWLQRPGARRPARAPVRHRAASLRYIYPLSIALIYTIFWTNTV